MVLAGNTFGGYILLGVKDNKTITGCKLWNEEKINNVFRDLIVPNPIFDIKRLSKDGIEIFVIRIDEGVEPPYMTNNGVIYERISSSSNPVKDSSTINRILEKRKENLKKIENKLYIPPIEEESKNLCGYLDFGFSVSSRDVTKFTKKILNANYEKIADIIKKTNNPYSISKVGYSICVTIGTVSYRNEHIDLPVPAGFSNFMEILPDGSVRGRIILTSESVNKGANVITTGVISMIYGIFKDIYSNIFDDKYSSNFIEARCYEKLNTLKLFEPKIIVNSNDEYYEKFENYHYQHKNKYGSNIIVSSNRIPMNDFYIIDKKFLEERELKYNDSNLFKQLFRTSYFLLGYIDEFKITDEN